MWKRIISRMSSAYLEQIYFGAAKSVHPGKMVEFCDGVEGGGLREKVLALSLCGTLRG